MVDFKKRALILTLAATVSVTGSFAADNYKNCLMDMEFQPVNDHEIKIVLNTKAPYSSAVTAMRKDAHTFLIMLPETDSQAPSPNLAETNYIKSVEITKMPYSNGAKGYTKILIKTSDVINLQASTAVYLPKPKDPDKQTTAPVSNPDNLREAPEAVRSDLSERQMRKRAERKDNTSKDMTQKNKKNRDNDSGDNKAVNDEEKTIINNESREESPAEETTAIDIRKEKQKEDSHQKGIAGLAVALIILISAFIYIQGQKNMVNAMGERLNIDLKDDDSEEKKRKPRRNRSINNTATTTDTLYSQPVSFKMEEPPQSAVNTQDDDDNIVDLDALFREKQSQLSEQPSNGISDALDDFLSGFSIDDAIDNIKNSESGKRDGYDEEMLDKLIESSDMTFTKDDVDCFQELLQSEISNEAINIADNYEEQETPKKSERLSVEKIIEKFVTDYAVLQHVIFNSNDIGILKKLVSVELDSNFVEDLSTDPKRTKEMESEIRLARSKSSKPAEITTLNVKDKLPNLADALKKQGNKPIESEMKPQVVYFSEGYEVNTLSVKDSLPDLTKELKKPNINTPVRPKEIETSDLSYADSVQKLSVSGLPDLQDVMANPDKYAEKPPEEYIPDENEMLSRLLNAQFKPFDDGYHNLEIVSDREDVSEDHSHQDIDIKKEFGQFSNFEVKEEEEEPEKVYDASEYDDFEALYNDNFVDLDKNLNSTEPPPDNSQKEFVPKDLKRIKSNIHVRKHREKSEKMENILKEIRQSKHNTAKTAETKPSNNEVIESEIINKPAASDIVKCILEGVNYDIVSSSSINSDIGCHLAKSDKGYAVLAYEGTNLSVLKEYDSISSEKIFSRLSETLADGTPRYIIKAGTNKLVVDIADNKIKYVMDL